MSLIAISIFVGGSREVPAALERANQAVASGARLIEWRCDAIAGTEHDLRTILQLVRESPMPCIVTIRPDYEGGSCDADETHRLQLLLDLAASDEGPRYLDVELTAVVQHPKWRNDLAAAVSSAPRDSKTSLILSSHDFDRRPADLLQRIEAMANSDVCSVIKIAWNARSLRDNLEIFDLLQSRQKPTIALSMGRFSLMSRVLAPKFGGFLTFATDAPAQATAPGQPTVQQLRETYRFDAISKTTQVYGVIGWPLEHSRSPQVHNAGFTRINHDGVLVPMPVPSEYEHFKATVGAMIDHAGLDFRGAAVTMPHKQHLLKFVRERGGRSDELTDRIGAANTLIVGSAGGISCTNTDCPAAVDALARGMRISRSELAEKHIVVLGAGGVARAVVVGVADAGAHVTVLNRDRDKAQTLLQSLDVQQADAKQPIDAVINCTPIGMAGGPDPNGLPLAIDPQRPIELDHTMTVFDTVYMPQRTPLLTEAEVRGARIITGEEMFFRQASLQFRQWTGVDAALHVG